jgi:Flp pilus assembly protein TadD
MESARLKLIAGALVVVLAFAASACANNHPLPPRAAALNRDGAIALAAGDLATAEARLALAIEYSPRFVEAYVNLGLVELRRGNLDLAYAHFKKARDLNPDLPAPHHALGLLFDQRDLGKEAEEHYRMAIKVDPGFPAARANLGRRLYQRRAFDDAREQFLRLTEIDAGDAMAWTGLVESLLRLGREGEADDALGRAREKLGDRPEIALLVARQMLRRGAYDDAEAILTPLTADPDHARQGVAWGFLAVARAGRGDCVSAGDAAREALLVDRTDPVAGVVLDACAPHAPRPAAATARAGRPSR